MSAPAKITLNSLDGQWVLNRAMSTEYDPLLKLQGVNWLMRKVLNMTNVILEVKEWEDPSDGFTHMDIDLKPTSGLPATQENKVLDFQGVDSTHALFGKIRVSQGWTGAKELDEEDSFLVDGMEEGINSFVHLKTEHLDYNAVTHQAWGFEDINGSRYHSRHIVGKKGNEVVRVKLVYDYLGPRSDAN
ncbi:hypothetical protein N7520_004521 [Penicillium odoratum]|uniref:uncharacterized protein n=1 Tax=Penicillium odoratum TaxID=1167516 RepID=UPI002548F9FB|nr:uncharacterized protein N7520_004521 [Penicillium odoratum]KAJ5764962.1 hypothetical protein N7520_004521 [Penicillium odoratum]